MSPTKKGEAGTRNLNKELQKVLNPQNSKKNERAQGETIFREGDKVMQMRNNYDVYWESLDGKSYGSGIYNGDLGVIKKINEEDIEVIFDDDKLVRFEASNLEELEHAYAITVHKSQGSEFPVVVLPLLMGVPMLYTRNLLYTAVTRARSMIVIVGNENVVQFMIDNNNIKERNTGLKYKIDKYLEIFDK